MDTVSHHSTVTGKYTRDALLAIKNAEAIPSPPFSDQEMAIIGAPNAPFNLAIRDGHTVESESNECIAFVMLR